jgi:cytochrome d ubiquinol oxidase subunit I
VGGSLVAFVLVYFAVFTAGFFYIVRLMANDPGAASATVDIGPFRAAGITPGPAVRVERVLPTSTN